jgi:DisA bacterial checkpoint controller nucleotide-binding
MGEHGYSIAEWPIKRLLQLMRATDSGGIFALLPASPSDDERIPYRRRDADILMRRIKERFKSLVSPSRTAHARAQLAVNEAIEDIARLSAIDGAVLAGPGLAVYGAGYIIKSLKEKELGDVMQAPDPAMSSLQPRDTRNGARHRAGFSLAHQREGAVVFIVSEDGPVTCAMRVDGRVVAWTVEVTET